MEGKGNHARSHQRSACASTRNGRLFLAVAAAGPSVVERPELNQLHQRRHPNLQHVACRLDTRGRCSRSLANQFLNSPSARIVHLPTTASSFQTHSSHPLQSPTPMYIPHTPTGRYEGTHAPQTKPPGSGGCQTFASLAAGREKAPTSESGSG